MSNKHSKKAAQAQDTTQATTIIIDYTAQAQAIMMAPDSREAFRQALLKADDDGRVQLVMACKEAQAQAQALKAQAQAQAQALADAERDLFGVPVHVQGNHRPESKGKALTEALSRGATMTELLSIRGAVPQHFAYLRKHGFTLTYDKSTGIYKATA